jgi:hypothetical protein
MFTPSHVIKTRVVKATFRLHGRYTCLATVRLPLETLAAQSFRGTDGRAVRRRAEEWAHQEAERQAARLCTAWQDVRDSKRSPWE